MAYCIRPAGVALAMFLGSVLLTTACKKKPAPQPDPVQPESGGPAPTSLPRVTGQPAQAPPLEAELSEVRVTFLSPRSFGLSVKYRFTQGGPAPNDWYMVAVNHSSGEGEETVGGAAVLTQVQGKDLKPEGELKQEFGTFKPFRPGQTFNYTASIDKGTSKGHYHLKVAAPLKGSVPYQP